MKLAILLVLSSEDRTRASVLESPMPYDQAASIFKRHATERALPESCAKAGFDVLELWTANGRQKHKKFDRPGGPAASVTAPEPKKPRGKKGAKDPAPAPAPAVPVSETAPTQAPVQPTAGSDEDLARIATALEAGQPVTPDDLTPFTLEQIAALCARYDIALAEGVVKEDAIKTLLGD